MILIRWYERNYLCTRCSTEWIDEWSCTCNDRCPTCDLETSPASWLDLSRELEPQDFEGAARRLGLNVSATLGAVTAEQARDYAEARLEGSLNS